MAPSKSSDPYDLVRDFYVGMGRMTFNPDRLKGLEDLLSPETMADKLAHEAADFASRILDSIVQPLQIAMFRHWGSFCTRLKLENVNVVHRRTALNNKLIVSIRGSDAEYTIVGQQIISLWCKADLDLHLLQEGSCYRPYAMDLLVKLIDDDFRYAIPEFFT